MSTNLGTSMPAKKESHKASNVEQMEGKQQHYSRKCVVHTHILGGISSSS